MRGRRVRKDRRAQQLESVLCINDDNEQNCPKITLWSPRGAVGPLGTIHGTQQILAHPSAHVEGWLGEAGAGRGDATVAAAGSPPLGLAAQGEEAPMQ